MSDSPEQDPEHTLDASGAPKRSSALQRNKIEKARDAAQDRAREESRKNQDFPYVDHTAQVKEYIAKREAASKKSHPDPQAAKDIATALHQVAEKLSARKSVKK